MAKKEILSEVTDVHIEFMDNGYNVRYTGRDANDDWGDVRLVMTNIDDLVNHLRMIDAKLKKGV
jgi:hypothetical protein